MAAPCPCDLPTVLDATVVVRYLQHARCHRPTPKPERDSEAEEAEAIRQRVKAFEAEAEQKKKQAEQEVDDMLADLKNRLKDR